MTWSHHDRIVSDDKKLWRGGLQPLLNSDGDPAVGLFLFDRAVRYHASATICSWWCVQRCREMFGPPHKVQCVEKARYGMGKTDIFREKLHNVSIKHEWALSRPPLLLTALFVSSSTRCAFWSKNHTVSIEMELLPDNLRSRKCRKEKKWQATETCGLFYCYASEIFTRKSSRTLSKGSRHPRKKYISLLTEFEKHEETYLNDLWSMAWSVWGMCIKGVSNWTVL